MNDLAKSMGAGVAAVVSWIAALGVHDMITFVLASVLTIASIIYVILGIQNRQLDKQIKRKKLEDER